MDINLNQTLTSLSAAYHAGKLTKAEYRLQRSIELERLRECAEEDKFLVESKNRKKHITVCAVLFCVLTILTVVVLLQV